MNRQLQGQVAVVTGGGRGIGRAIALELAKAGARVAVTARTGSQVEETAATIEAAGGRALGIAHDVTDRDGFVVALDRIEDALGPVDLLVNNAGRFNAIGPSWEVDPEDWWQDVTVNVYGLYLCCHVMIPRMLERGGGRIINLIGGGVGGPFPHGSGYGTSKAAVMRFTECLAAELKDAPVVVFAMGPGFVRTEMTERQEQTEAGKKWLPWIKDLFEKQVNRPPEDAGRLAVRLASGEFDALRGRAFDVSDDLEAVAAEAEAILEADRKTLRMT